MRILIGAQMGLFRFGLERVLRDTVPQLDLTEADGHAELLSLLKAGGFDLIIVLLPFADADSEAVILSLRTLAPTTSLLVASDGEDKELVTKAVAAGVVGYVPSNIDSESMGKIVQHVLSGGIHLPPGFRQPIQTEGEVEANSNTLPKLSTRELEVAYSMMAGNTNKMIAESLGITASTVKQHLYIIMRVLNVKSRTECAYKLSLLGLRPGEMRNSPILSGQDKNVPTAPAAAVPVASSH